MADNSVVSAYATLIPKFENLSGAVSKSVDAIDSKGIGAKFANKMAGGFKASGAMAVAVGNLVSGAVSRAASGAASAIGGAFSTAFDGFADYEQLSGGISKLFGTAGQSVEQYAEAAGKSVSDVSAEYANLELAQSTVMDNASRAYRTAGMSANEYMEQVSSFSAALVNSLGGDTVEAANRADVAMRAISDNVNTFGTDAQSVANAFQGFAKQNYTMLDNLKLGYGGTKAEMERLIADANEWGAANGKASDLSIESFADVVTAIDQIQQKQNIWGTTAREAMGTVSGSINMLKGSWTNLVSSFGRADADFGQLAKDLNESLGAVFDNVVPMVGRIASNVVQNVPMVFSQLGGAIEESLIPHLQDALGNVSEQLGLSFNLDAFADLGNALEKPLKAVGDAAGKIGDGIGRFLAPIGDFVTGNGPAFEGMMERIDGIVADAQPLFDLLGEAAGRLGDAFADAGPFVAEVLGNVASAAVAVGTALGYVASFAMDVAGILVNAVTGAPEAFSSAASTIQGAFEAVVGFFASIPERIGGFFAEVVSGAQARFDDLVSFVMGIPERIVGFFAGIGERISAAFGSIHFPQPEVTWEELKIGDFSTPISIPRITWHGNGAIYDRPTVLAGVGEKGREAIIPLTGAAMRPFAEAIASEMGGGEIHNHYTIEKLEYLPGTAVADAVGQIFGYARDYARM